MKLFSRGKRAETQPQPQTAVAQLPAERLPPQNREEDAIYQNGRVVARVSDPKADWEAKEIRFAEVSNSDELMLPDECEFQQYKILVQRIAHATKTDRGALHKGRVLRDVVAEILGYREQ
jgi:hypothetical protein